MTFDSESALSNRCVLSKCPNRLEKAHGEFAKFDVEEVIDDSIDGLWDRTSPYAGINRDLFLKYFAGCEIGYAIEIGSVRPYAQPLDLADSFGIRPPQSFVYI